jgi:adenine/guanine phosphoribosyltransferase-like PRPP-binding protein
MTFGVSWLELMADGRGNRLDEYHALQKKDRSAFYIDLVCCEDVAKQVEWALEDRAPRRVEPPSGSNWAHRIQYQGPFTSAMNMTLQTLQSVLTLRGTDELDGAFALDFYKVPEEGVPGTEWDDTEAGALVNRGKYRGNDLAGRKLCDQIAHAIQSHRAYARCEAVILIPGTAHNFGERLAKGVARRLGVPCVCSERSVPATGQAKEGRVSAELELYQICEPSEVDERRVVIVDDVYRTGISMRSVAVAAEEAGASEIFGAVGARTMRN